MTAVNQDVHRGFSRALTQCLPGDAALVSKLRQIGLISVDKLKVYPFAFPAYEASSREEQSI